MENPLGISTFIIRHTRENLKKCSLRGLEKRSDFAFFCYPDCVLGKETLPDFAGCVLLDIEGEPLSTHDRERKLILLDGTWRLAEKMARCIPELTHVPKRCIPKGFQTAYPRRQEDCSDPASGLASIEALYIAFFLMERPLEGLFDHYYWKNAFFEKNALLKNP